MKYYYLTADGTTAGPETLEVLCGMLGNGIVGMGTLVVPAGGEDWTPLARVLRFFYADAAGAAAGPVPFSELNRLHQTAVLPGAAWVMEEHGADWKTLAVVLTAAGVPVISPAPAAAHSPAPVWRPPAGGRTAHLAGGRDTRASHKGSRKGTIRHHPGGGMERAPFIAFALLLIVLAAIVLLAVGFQFSRIFEMNREAWTGFWNRHHVALTITACIIALGFIVTALLRIRNIGWPWAYLVLLLFPIPLLAFPPGYARHRRFDTAAKIIAGVSAALILAGVALSMIYWKPGASPGSLVFFIPGLRDY